jgi:hypothetical protein
VERITISSSWDKLLNKGKIVANSPAGTPASPEAPKWIYGGVMPNTITFIFNNYTFFLNISGQFVPF